MHVLNCHNCGEENDIEFDDVILYINNGTLTKQENIDIIRSVIGVESHGNAYQDIILEDFISKFKNYCKSGTDFKIEVSNGVLKFERSYN